MTPDSRCEAGKKFELVHLRVGRRGILGAPDVLEVAVLRADARVVQPAKMRA